jgi:hypothetical protein
MLFVKVVGIMPEHSCSFALRAIFFSDSSRTPSFAACAWTRFDQYSKLNLLLRVSDSFPLKFQHFRIVGTIFRGKCSEFNAKALAAKLHLYRAVVKSLRRFEKEKQRCPQKQSIELRQARTG